MELYWCHYHQLSLEGCILLVIEEIIKALMYSTKSNILFILYVLGDGWCNIHAHLCKRKRVQTFFKRMMKEICDLFLFLLSYCQSIGISSYPLYHSMYETFHLVSEIMDPSFEYHLAVSRVWAEMARNLADSLILPFNCTDYTANLEKSVKKLKEDYEEKMNQQGIDFGKFLLRNIVCFWRSHNWIHCR